MQRKEMAVRNCVIVLLVAASFAASVLTAGAEEAGKIQDNSFLLEVAYNQEDGVVQHIQTWMYIKKTKSWLYTFTQEWPVPKQTHQLSYSIPVAHVVEGQPETGLGDAALNYRYQLLMAGPYALAPRISVLLPTGDYKKGMGSGATGYQVNIPFSMELSDEWVTHWNAGMTFTPGAKEPGGATADTTGYNLGASVIWLTSETFNLMTEIAFNRFQTVQPDGGRAWEETFFVNPGMRFAMNYRSGLQVVPGLAFPVGIGTSHGEYGVFLYLSFEHPLF
ncbi:MAG TPA: transporter [Nitrospirota bacterium]|nr:transporter [Nitrospirota bacterium]